MALLNQQMKALREQIAGLADALDASERLAAQQKVQIASLGKKLNAALATKVQELSRYRSEFFGRLRELLGGQKGIRVVGDRFVFQSEVLFDSASAELGAPGKVQLAHLAESLKAIAAKIPKDLDWVLRVDGHTDKRPISTAPFPIELGAFDRAGDFGGAFPDRQRHFGRSTGGHRLRRIPTHRPA